MSSMNYLEIKEYEQIFSAFDFLKREFFSFDGNLEIFVRKICENGICFVCEDNGVCGVIAFYANDSKNYTAYITSVLVSKSSRGKGIGTKLIRIAEDVSRDKKMTKIRLEVNVNNSAAKSLYEKLGYVEVQRKDKSIYLEKKLHTQL